MFLCSFRYFYGFIGCIYILIHLECIYVLGHFLALFPENNYQVLPGNLH